MVGVTASEQVKGFLRGDYFKIVAALDTRGLKVLAKWPISSYQCHPCLDCQSHRHWHIILAALRNRFLAFER